MSAPCPTCAAAVPDGQHHCSACGAVQATLAEGYPAVATADRLKPGTVLAGRYLLEARLGRGGMGDVWKADDLTLGQPVALKFLAADTGRLAQFRQEVKLSRTVSHPNVCRVYDIVEADGPPFLVMEFVDGYDLAGLLSKGPPPAARATAIARQICLGLAAAHARGVLHRDLKPANILLDRDGEVRIADFGLAVPAAEGAIVSGVAGTPAYMAPEQLHGRSVSAGTDLFALGLVLFELYTGRRLFPGPTLEDLKRQHAQGLPTRPLHDAGPPLDPAVEQVILKCLAAAPADRPPTAAHVLLALPGGDRLEAAVLAGETPSPEMVVAADVGGGLRPVAAVALLAVMLACLAMLAWGRTRTSVITNLPVKDHPPEVLKSKAREVVHALGYPDPPRDNRWNYFWDFACLEYVQTHSPASNRWQRLGSGQPAALYFWYVQSPDLLSARGPHYPGVPGQVTPGDPPMVEPGMTSVSLDVTGRLVRFQRVPPRDTPAEPVPAYDFRPLFEAAGLNPAAFRSIPPTRTPPSACDQQAAWQGVFPDRTDLPLTVTAAAYRGKPVHFEMLGPWEPAAQPVLVAGAHGSAIGDVILFAATLVVAAVGLPIGWRNWKSGRGDWRAAGRLVLIVLAVEFVLWAAQADHVPRFVNEMNLLWSGLGRMVLLAGMFGLGYLALEPYVRRRWPWRLVSWRRVLAGRLRDPAVGRDLLLGLCWGVAAPCIAQWTVLGPDLLGLPTDTYRPSPNRLAQPALYGIASAAAESLSAGLPWFLLLCVLTAVLRSQAVAVAVVGVGVVVSYHPWWHEYPVLCTALLVVCYLGGAYLALRYGLLAVLGLFLAEKVVGSAALTTDLSAWYGVKGWMEAGVILALAGYAYWTATGGRSPCGREFLSGD